MAWSFPLILPKEHGFPRRREGEALNNTCSLRLLLHTEPPKSDAVFNEINDEESTPSSNRQDPPSDEHGVNLQAFTLLRLGSWGVN